MLERLQSLDVPIRVGVIGVGSMGRGSAGVSGSRLVKLGIDVLGRPSTDVSDG